MKFGVPWRAKGIRPEARETAIEAARRSGMSLDDWLNSVVLQQAAQMGVQPYAQHGAAAAPANPREIAAVNNRLDDLTRRIEQFTRTGPAAYAPQRPMHAPDPRAELIGRLDQYVTNARPQLMQPMQPAQPMPVRQQPQAMAMPPALGRALSDIAARQQMLNGGAAPSRRPAPQGPAAYAPPHAQPQGYAQAPAPTLPTQDLSGLEEQLRKITDQIETLRHPGVEEAINALRAELGEIGHALGEAMPRHSIETIERQIQGLSQRIAEGRQSGVDQGALTGIEHGLVEVRNALQGLTPAESLIGFNDAVAGLAHKIDLIVAQKDPQTMAQLEKAITTLRDMANHVASNDAVSSLAAEVQALTDKVDYIARASGNTDALSSLEHRIDALGQALAERAQNGAAVPPRLEALVQSLTDKIEQIQAAQAHGGDVAGGHLDERIAQLVQRLDVSDSRLSQLEAIERGLADLLMHIEQSQGSGRNGPAGGAAAVDAFKLDFAQAQESLKEALKNDLVHSQAEIKGDIARTQDALYQVHGTLGELVQRLASIEQSIRNEARAQGHPDFRDAPAQTQFHEQARPRFDDEEPFELTQPVGKLAVRMVDDAPGMAAFDDMPPTRTVPPGPTVYEPYEPEPAELEPLAPPLKPASPPIPPGLAALMEQAPEQPARAPLPRAPQLRVQDQIYEQPARAVAAPQPSTPPAIPPNAPIPPAAPPKKRAAPHAPINPDLPPDLPLEPGSGPPPLRANPGARLAASGAALGRARTAAETPAGGKTSFIAAARRAAQTAMQHEPAPQSEPAFEGEAQEPQANPLRNRMMRRMKSLFVAASIIAIVVGSVQIAATYLNFGKPSAPTTKTTQQHLGMDRRADGTSETASAHQVQDAAASASVPPQIAATPLALAPPNASIDLLAPPDQTVQLAAVPTTDPRHATQSAAAKAAAAADITGSIPEAAAERSTQIPGPAPLARASELPVGIGGARLRQAAVMGNGAAAYEVAMRFAEGRGVPANLTQAARWYERAANQGLAPAQFRLASLLEKGEGVKKDLARARALYFSAARQGNAKAMHNLAVLYAEGIDGKPDYATAVQWFREAAEHGVSDSQYNLGILYARGIGVEKSLAESYKWFALAAKHGDHEAAKKRDEVATHLDAKALAAARQLVAKFVAAPQPHQATMVPVPPGGWDKTAAGPSARVMARTADASTVGKR